MVINTIRLTSDIFAALIKVMGRFSKSQLRKLSTEQLKALKVERLSVNYFESAEAVQSVIDEKRTPKYFNVKPGRKTKGWNKARTKLKAQDNSDNLKYCQFQFPGCWGEADGYSHPVKKSRGGKNEGCILSCNFCHNLAENAEDKIQLHEQARAKRVDRIYSAA